MEEGRLLKVAIDDEGHVSHAFDAASFGSKGSAKDARGGLPFVGLHGISPSSRPGKAWVTLQYTNQVLLVDVATLTVEIAIPCPQTLPDGRGPIGGPHTVRESHGALFVCLKGGASVCHGEPPDAAQEARHHALWRVALDEQMRPVDDGVLFECPPTPVMCDVTKEGDCWIACDASPTLFRVPWDAQTGMDCIFHQLPYQYARLRQTGPGLTIGPDGRPWFCILQGNGVLGRISPCGHVQTFELHKTFNERQRICHLSWDADGVLYAISSDLVDKKALNTLIRVQFDATHSHVIAQHEIAFPSQHTCVHRILHLDGGANPSVLISELSKSQVLQVFKHGLPPLSDFPMKTIEVTTRLVYDAAEPCPRSGNPTCHCASNLGATIPTENIWSDPSADEVYDAARTPSIVELQKVTDPRTGEEELLHDFSKGTRADSAFSKFWAYGVKGFDVTDAPLVSMYAANGNPAAVGGAQPGGGKGKLGASVPVLRFKPAYLRRLLKREPWRRAMLLEELHAAGLDEDELELLCQQRGE